MSRTPSRCTSHTVCKSRRPEGTRLVLSNKARLTACINFCYKTRHRETTIGSGGGFDLQLLSGTAHIFGSPRDTRGGWRVRVFFGLLSFVLHVVPRSAPRGVSGPHITVKGTDFGRMLQLLRNRYLFLSVYFSLLDSLSRTSIGY